MAFGKPLIASNIKGNRECVFHGENGLLCAPQQPGEFRKAIERLYTDVNLYQAMSRHCTEYSRRYFDIEQNAACLRKLYEERLSHAQDS
jgi:glycosyltransferase involved in cell wall biosynthesis